MTNEQEVREAFERRFADHAWFNPYSMDGDSYLDGSTNLAWEVWKAAAQSIRDQEAAKVAMLVDTLEKLSHLGMNDMHPYKQMIDSSLSATKPTADAFVARIKAAVKEEDAAILKEYVPDFVWEQLPADSAAKQAIGRLLNDAAELRNAKEV